MAFKVITFEKKGDAENLKGKQPKKLLYCLIFIANNKPAMNKEFIHEISSSANKTKIIILNHGSIVMLQSCCTF